MRKLMWFTIGFAAACGICSYGMMRAWILPVAISAAILGIVFLFAVRKHTILPPAIAVLLGCAMGIGWFCAYHLLYIREPAKLDGEEAALSVTASDYCDVTEYGTRVDGIVTVKGKPYQIRTYLREEINLSPGDRLNGSFRVRLTLPDDQDDSTWLQGKGIFLTAYQTDEISVVRASQPPKWCLPAVLRHEIISILEELFPEDVFPFTKALLLGDSSDLDYGTDTAFKVSGIRHIIAVSGLHVSILYGFICVFTMRRRFLTAAVGMPLLLLFAAVAGFTPSVTRACIMVWLMLLAMVFDREYDAPTALSFAVLVMLLANPLAVTSVSLQLSAGCVAGILLFNVSISSWLKEKLPKRKGIAGKLQGLFCSSVSVTLSAMSLITPLAALSFGTVSLVGVISNLLTLWAVNLVFNGLIVICGLYFLLPGAASVLTAVLSLPVRYVLWTAKALASFPLASVYTQSVYIICWLVFLYILLSVFFLMQHKQPRVLLCCGTVGLCIALLASWAEPLTADTKITMLDVGQGQSILLQSEGKTFLVDCGGDSDTETADLIAETLRSQGITRLNGIILTHYDQDHAGALYNLLTRIDTDVLFLPDTRNAFLLPEFDGTPVYVWEDMELTYGNTCLKLYGPVYAGLDNENSVCVLFDTEKCDILITGDRSEFGERMLLRRTDLPDVDILVAGHHGAENSTSEELLKKVIPEMVLISVGQDNIYGHPAPALLQRLEALGCTVYRTDRHGTIVIRR